MLCRAVLHRGETQSGWLIHIVRLAVLTQHTCAAMVAIRVLDVDNGKVHSQPLEAIKVSGAAG